MTDNPYGVMYFLQQGDWVNKSVALLLLLMSVLSWTVIVRRAWALWKLRAVQKAAREFWHANSFASGLELLKNAHQSSGPKNPFFYLANEGQQALAHHTSHRDDLHGHLPLADWLTSSLKGAIDESAEQLQRGLAVLASVGSVAPFVGLFGTVWGIYHALVSLGASGQASIDKIAGPVGEALIMTAFGLAVAIPATLTYNAFSRSNKGIVAQLNRFAFQLHAYFITGAAPKASVSAVNSVNGAA
jgi:biopolymer transport protein ExbB